MVPTEGLPEPKLLLLFEVLYTTGSVTRAAEQLGQSQPTISLWLAKLRRQLRDPLFVRTPSGMKPTPQAEALITPCRELLESLRRLVNWEVNFDPATAQRHFRLCMSDASHITLLSPLLRRLREIAPGIRLEITRIDGNTEKALEIGEADLAIGFIPWLGDSMYQQVLFPQDWVCLVSTNHPRITAPLTATLYAQEGHVQVNAGTGQKLLDAGLVKANVERRIVSALPGFLGVGAVIRNTDLIVTLPRQIGETLAETYELQIHECPIPVESFSVKQHWHARYHQDAGNRWLRSQFFELFSRS